MNLSLRAMAALVRDLLFFSFFGVTFWSPGFIALGAITGKTKDEAMQEYITKVTQLQEA